MFSLFMLDRFGWSKENKHRDEISWKFVAANEHKFAAIDTPVVCFTIPSDEILSNINFNS
jgi:hypothetical protein